MLISSFKHLQSSNDSLRGNILRGHKMGIFTHKQILQPAKCCVLRKYILLAVLLIIKLINIQNSDNCHSVSESAVQRELNGHTRVADTLLVRVKANLSKLTFFFPIKFILGFCWLFKLCEGFRKHYFFSTFTTLDKSEKLMSSDKMLII